MRTGIYGGSFNPPHMAHLMVCAYALASGEVDRVLVIPCARHAFNKEMIPYNHRLKMCQLAIEDIFQNVEVSDIESQRSEISYMIDTLKELQIRHPDDSFRLIIGTDILEEIPRWKEPDQVREIAPILVVPRLDSKKVEQDSGDYHFTLPEISSSLIRKKLSSNESINGLVPAKVENYILGLGNILV